MTTGQSINCLQNSKALGTDHSLDARCKERTEEVVMLIGQSGMRSRIDALISAGVDVEYKISRGNGVFECMLHRAAVMGDIDTCRTLVKHGANVNSLNDMGDTALTLVVYNANAGFRAVVDFFLQNNADLNIQNNLNDTAISYTNKSSIDVAIKLYEAGADINISAGGTGKPIKASMDVHVIDAIHAHIKAQRAAESAKEQEITKVARRGITL